MGENGEPVGFVVPARNAYHPVIAYLGVVPEHRGHGSSTASSPKAPEPWPPRTSHASARPPTLGNVPMAKAFARAGYVNFERAINMAW